MSATPRPWDFKPEKLFNGTHVAGRAPEIIAGARLICKMGGFDEISTANAELICRAVNSFDDLLAACKAAEDHIEELREAWQEGRLSEHDRMGGMRSNRNLAVQSLLLKALSKAESK